MRIALTATLLLAISFGASAGVIAELASGSGGYAHCSCPIKGPCCKGPVCKMELARRHAAGVTLQPCGEPPSDAALPLLPRWIALLPQAPALDVATAPAHPFVADDVLPVAGFVAIPDHPPRPLPATA
ncbi:MAG TPA: hypothetical protein VE974_21855 [Thermoanaerobaculia bacterium]|nr:hypothetical protein [Thermoanaerobaculia bacterium]